MINITNNERIKELQAEYLRFALELEEKSDQKKIELIRKDPEFVLALHGPTYSMILEAVKLDGYLYKYFAKIEKKLDLSAIESLRKAAVRQNGMVIIFMRSPSEEVQDIAVRQNPYAITFIEEPSQEIRELALASYISKYKGTDAEFEERIRFVAGLFKSKIKERTIQFLVETQ